ncbi:MAG TPA: RNA methyltransferase [Rhodospirillales bacterium]|nr:RNA methyltransferase [Rhodospirillales bacterium]
MRGYFGIGVEGISKAMNVGSIFRTAHAFGAGFVFTVAATYDTRAGGRADTSDATAHVPFYGFPDLAALVLPQKCALVGVELIEDSVDLPSFRHPPRAAYILGPERASLSPPMVERCDHIIKIPTRFCVNVGVAAAIVMYDRVQSLGRFQRRPERPGGPTEPLDDAVFGGPKFRHAAEKYRTPVPGDVHPREDD